MTTVAIVTRRLKEGKTYDDFRKAWFHTVGFGTTSKLHTAINAIDPREIIVIGFVEIEPGQDPMKLLQIEVSERLANPLDDVIEEGIGRTFGILVSEDDFSGEGAIDYRPASVHGQETDFREVAMGIAVAKQLVAKAMEMKEEARVAR